ncbi:MAG: nitroreductase [Oscillospiraceae bacterium]|jgi:nitroreductase|nr:nitroreductase [Oscillospiraceae bacterium]
MGNPVLSAISDRRSIRAYEQTQLTKEQLDTLLKAAQESPSARNAQPWRFSVVQNPDILAEINGEAKKNLGADLMDIFYGAPTAIFLSGDPEWIWSAVDCGIAVQTIALAAHSIGLGSVILGLPDAAFRGDKAEYFSKLLKFPDKFKFIIAIAVGVPTATKEAHPLEPDRVIHVG